MKNFSLPSVLLTGFLLVFPLVISAQRVGLVLSGGGAKGVAHVGVLKALEEHDIPIDYITGTSMGALVGGMYALGLSPDSIEKIVTGEEFQKWALGIIDEEYNFYYKRRNPRATWLSMRFNVDSIWQYRMPTNLVSPIQMDFAGVEYFSAINPMSRQSFDSLYVPFRCVAADVEAKRAVVMSQGDLFQAVRASMTFPFVFRPIRVDGKLLFDGGIYNNFPVDVMQADFQPDFIIGSVVASKASPLVDDDIRTHLENMLVSHTDYSVNPEIGILIRPQVPDLSVTDFSSSKEVLQQGYLAALEQIDIIKESVSRKFTYEQHQKKRAAFTSRKPPVIIDKIYVTGLNEGQQTYISNLLLKHGQPTPVHELKVEYFKLMAEDHIDRIDPRAEYNPETGYFDLYLDVTMENNMMLQFGGNISSSPVNFAYVGAQFKHMGYQATRLSLNTYFGRFYSGAQLSGRMDFSYPNPFFMEINSVINYYDYFRSSTTFFEDRTPSYLLQNQNYYQFNLGIPARYTGRMLWGAVRGRNRDNYYHTNQFGRNDTADQTTFTFFSPYFRFERTTLNYRQYPTSGSYLDVCTRFVTGNERYVPGTTSPELFKARERHQWWQLRAEYLNYFYRHPRLTLGVYGELFLSNQPLFSNYTSTLLASPAFQYVPEARTRFLPHYRAHHYLVSGFNGIIPVSRLLDFRLEAYMFQPYRKILKAPDNFTAEYASRMQTPTFLSSALLVAQTPLGPISLGLNYFHRHDEPFSLSFNFGYLIFNDHPLR